MLSSATTAIVLGTRESPSTERWEWIGLFWGEVMPAVPDTRVGLLRHHRTMTGATIVMIAETLAIAVLAGPLYDFCLGAAQQLTDPTMYKQAVRTS